MTREEFLAAATAAARESSAVSGFDPGITIAQAALESNWGQSALSRIANNYFGIKLKAGRESIDLPTWEVIGGKRVQIRARFSKFASMAECFIARDSIIRNAPCYAEARRCAADPEAFTRALAAHWATDPKYAEKVLSVWRRSGLDAIKLVAAPLQR